MGGLYGSRTKNFENWCHFLCTEEQEAEKMTSIFKIFGGRLRSRAPPPFSSSLPLSPLLPPLHPPPPPSSINTYLSLSFLLFFFFFFFMILLIITIIFFPFFLCNSSLVQIVETTGTNLRPSGNFPCRSGIVIPSNCAFRSSVGQKPLTLHISVRIATKKS